MDEVTRLRGLSGCRVLSWFYRRVREFPERGPGERFGVGVDGVVLWSHSLGGLRERFMGLVRGFVADSGVGVNDELCSEVFGDGWDV